MYNNSFNYDLEVDLEKKLKEFYLYSSLVIGNIVCIAIIEKTGRKKLLISGICLILTGLSIA